MNLRPIHAHGRWGTDAQADFVAVDCDDGDDDMAIDDELFADFAGEDENEMPPCQDASSEKHHANARGGASTVWHWEERIMQQSQI